MKQKLFLNFYLYKITFLHTFFVFPSPFLKPKMERTVMINLIDFFIGFTIGMFFGSVFEKNIIKLVKRIKYGKS